MWRSFGGSSGMGWGGAGARGGSGGYGGGGSGGGGMFRTVTRVSRAGLSKLKDNSSPSSSSFSTSSPKNAAKRGLTMSSKSADVCANSTLLSNSNLGFGPAWPLSSNSSFSDESDCDWVRVHDEFERTEIESDSVSLDDCVFGSAPSPIEAETALISLQNTLQTSCHSASDWIDPASHSHSDEQSILYPDIGRVYDAFHLLQTETSIQRMVISLSSDKAVWNAVLNNEAVQELKEAFRKDEVNALETSGNEPNPSTSTGNVLSWIFDNMRAKFMEFLTGITDLMKELLQPPPSDDMGNFPDGFSELVRSAFMLTAIVLLIVVVTRAGHA